MSGYSNEDESFWFTLKGKITLYFVAGTFAAILGGLLALASQIVGDGAA